MPTASTTLTTLTSQLYRDLLYLTNFADSGDTYKIQYLNWPILASFYSLFSFFPQSNKKLSRHAFFDCEKCIPKKMHPSSKLHPPQMPASRHHTLPQPTPLPHPYHTSTTHPTTTHEVIGAYLNQILKS